MENNLNENVSILRSGLNFTKAVIEATHDVVLNGNYEGTLNSTAKVTLEPSAKFKGTIKCKDFECSGKFDGVLEVANLAIFHGSSIVNGKVSVGVFSAENGATFSSEIKVVHKAPVAPVKK